MPVTNDEISRAVEGRTIPSAFLDSVAALGDQPVLRWKGEGDDEWGQWTFDEYADRVARLVTSLRAAGIRRDERVVLMMRNIPQFHLLDMAAYFAGATPVSLYNSSSAEQIAYLVANCEAAMVVVEDQDFLDRVLQVRDQLPTVRHLAVVDPAAADEAAGVVTFDSLLDAEPADLAEAAASCRPDQIATMIYTSGTTGPPKGVMLSHANIAWTVESLRRALPFTEYAGKRVVSYLPMAHVAERMVSHYAASFLGFEVTTCPDFGVVAEYFRNTRPNVVFGVPRVWEKVHAGVNAAVAADPDKQKALNEAIEAALPIAEALDWGTATDEQKATYDFLDQVAFSTVRDLVGLDQVELAVSGAAPLPPDVLRWFRAIGVPLGEIYGLSETSGPMTWAPTHVKPGTIGPPIPGCEVRLADDGEILCRGGNVFLGYLNDPERTAAVLDADGWFHSGDIGTVDDDGYFTIIDRKKELLITAGGKNVSPANLEAALKRIAIVGQACAIGDDRPYIAALVTLDPDQAPAWATAQGISFDSLADLANKPEVEAEVQRGLDEVMADFNHAESVKRVRILGEEWLPDGPALTPTSKLKRRSIAEHYAVEIASLYA
jgi:long-chain acyl-CoA synthetase